MPNRGGAEEQARAKAARDESFSKGKAPAGTVKDNKKDTKGNSPSLQGKGQHVKKMSK